MKLEELHEGMTDNVAHAVIAFAAAVGVSFALAFSTIYADYKTSQDIIQQIANDSPTDAEEYKKHFQAYISAVPKTNSAGDPEKAKQELKAIKIILDKHQIKK